MTHEEMDVATAAVMAGVALVLTTVAVVGMLHAAATAPATPRYTTFVFAVGVCTGFVLGSLTRLL